MADGSRGRLAYCAGEQTAPSVWGGRAAEAGGAEHGGAKETTGERWLERGRSRPRAERAQSERRSVGAEECDRASERSAAMGKKEKDDDDTVFFNPMDDRCGAAGGKGRVVPHSSSYNSPVTSSAATPCHCNREGVGTGGKDRKVKFTGLTQNSQVDQKSDWKSL